MLAATILCDPFGTTTLKGKSLEGYHILSQAREKNEGEIY
jgi:hypothetical protein